MSLPEGLLLDPTLIALLPRRLAVRCKALPLARTERTLTILRATRSWATGCWSERPKEER